MRFPINSHTPKRSREQFFIQFEAGGMAYIGTVRDDLRTLVGRPGMSLREWAQLHKDEIVALAASE